MIQSMTGYGKATAELSDKKINVEIKQVSGVNMEQAKLIQEISAQSKSLQDISQHVENLTAKTE